MSNLTQEQVVAYISGLRLAEVQSLISVLEDTLGVSAAVPTQPIIHAAYGVPEPDVQYEFDVVLDGFSGRKIDVIKAVRKLTGLGLKDAKECVESAPSVLREAVDRSTADEFRAELVAAGADVTIR